jgi:hypothetical protein
MANKKQRKKRRELAWELSKPPLPNQPSISQETYTARLVEIALLLKQIWRSPKTSDQAQPPANLDFILYFLMPRADCDALIGDLAERYSHLVERLGKVRADLWYAKQVLTSVWPLLSSWVRRLGSSTVVNALCLVLRFFGLGGMAEDLKQLSGAKRKQK